ncbi:MAG: FAD-dependent oxidoreductase [Myxococcota bacterium]|nr:FAD-dependent oxidoreductase [Myxococcota bacterium]
MSQLSLRPPFLPPLLAERLLSNPAPRAGEFVLYWPRVSVRAQENPALDVARFLAAELDLPLLTYHGLSERYPHASDRHHAFILQGARDMQRALRERGERLVSHVQRRGHRQDTLKALAQRAAVVVVEAMPMPFLQRWTQVVAELAPLWEVDASCLVPLGSLDKQPQRAFALRKKTTPLRQDPYAAGDWDPPTVRAFGGDVGFASLDLTQIDLAELIGQCDVDHTVCPVAHTQGGSVAATERWEAFLDGPIQRYARDRNNAARPLAVSRLSPWLHYGHISPFRVARQAMAVGADKFLDELLVWRELAWHHCHHAQVHPQTWEALPQWARDTLLEHEDHSSAQPPWNLDEGRTGIELFDLCARSLRTHGELHNNLRMTWGKALLGLSHGPKEALAWLFGINNRYALDGRDPNSVAGLSWCLGNLDRPFAPARPVFGRVRSRSVAQHAKRLDIPQYRRWVERPIGQRLPRVLVVGAGLAGAAAAWTLRQAGVPHRVVDKGRGVGGRMSSRRSEAGRFDHGAQCFTVRDDRFFRTLDLLAQSGHAAQWHARLGRFDGTWSPLELELEHGRWVGAPTMNAIPKALLEGSEVDLGVRVTGVHREGDGWRVVSADGELGLFDEVILTLPAPQAVALLGPENPLSQELARVQIAPCWAGLAVGEAGLEWEAAEVVGSPLRWVARQDVLAGRQGVERWVLHASPQWSAANLECTKEQAAQALGQAFTELTGRAWPELQAHRWRYSLVTQALGVDFLSHQGLRHAGDGCLGGRVEAAYLSGVAAAGAVVREAVL